MTLQFSYGHTNKVYSSPSQSTHNKTLTLSQLISHIKSEPPKAISKIRKIVKYGFENGTDAKDIKKAIKIHKNSLDWILLSGTCPIHHNNDTLSYNGVIQIDIDFKFLHGDTKALDVKERLKAFDFVMFAAISPSAHGVKAAIHTDNNNKEHHKKVTDAIIFKLSRELNIEKEYFDTLGASQPCFVPYDADVYYNENYTTFDTLSAVVEFEQSKMNSRVAPMQRKKVTTCTDATTLTNLKLDTDVLEYLVSEIENNRIDLTDTFQNWCAIAFSVASIGSRGAKYFHRIARMNSSYDEIENEKLFADALKTGKAHQNIGHLINECKNANIDITPIFEKRHEALQDIEKNIRLTLSHGEYLATKISVTDFQTGTHILYGGTGIGKTYFAAHSFERVVVVSRNVTTLENYSQYGFKQFLKSDEKSNFADISTTDGKRITVTYKSFRHLLDVIDTSQYVFFFDEAHLLNESFSKVESETRFCYDAVKHLSEKHIVILMSANVIYYNADITIRKVFHVRKVNIEKKVNVFYNSNLNALTNSIKTAHRHGKRVLVYTNRKEHGHTISEHLKEHLHSLSLFFFDSDKHGHTDLQNLRHDVTLTTSALVTGKDVNNENMCVIFYDLSDTINTMPSRASVVQFLGRVRKYETAQYEIHFEYKEHSAFGTYSLFNIRNNRMKAARLTLECSYDDISFFVENKHGYVKRNGDGYEIDYFNIDKSIQRAVSLHTLLNSERLSEYLKAHHYTANISTLKDVEPILADVEKVNKKELYEKELDAIETDTAHEYDIKTNVLNRYNVLRKCTFSHTDAISILRNYYSKSDWLMFVNLLAVEKRLTNRDTDGFHDMYHDVLSLTPSHKTAKYIIRSLAKTRTVFTFELARIVKSTRELDFDNKYHARNLFAQLKHYYEIETARNKHTRTYKLCETHFLSLTANSDAVTFSRLTDLKKVCEIM